MSTSDSSSAASPSPPASPVTSIHEPPTLGRLVVHFVSAKRSLTSTSYVWRANEIVTSSRALIEEIAVLNAKNAFARRGIDDQLETLSAIRDGVAEYGETADVEFATTIAALDTANDRLQRTLVLLRKTVVDASLRPTASAESARDTADSGDPNWNDDDDQTKAVDKTLYDYVDETRFQGILASLHALIDRYNDVRAEFSGTIDGFDEDIKTMTDSLLKPVRNSGPKDKVTIYDEPPPSIPELFHRMEDHAAEMASLLENLVSHYDLCVTALKHTEGGGEAAKAAVQQADELTIKTAPGAEESLYRKKVAVPISEHERAEMLAILQTDALEVDDVAADLKDHSEGLEKAFESLTQHAGVARTSYTTLRRVLASLHDVKATMPQHVLSSKIFREAWQSIQSDILGKTQELLLLAEFNEGFLTTYSKVLEEAHRRQTAATQMKKVAEKAKRELLRLHTADREMRADFEDAFGGFIPRDLWPMMREGASAWNIRLSGPSV